MDYIYGDEVDSPLWQIDALFDLSERRRVDGLHQIEGLDGKNISREIMKHYWTLDGEPPADIHKALPPEKVQEIQKYVRGEMREDIVYSLDRLGTDEDRKFARFLRERWKTKS